MLRRLLFVLTIFATTAHAQSKKDLKDQLTRLQTDLAEARKFTSSLSDRLATVEAQQEFTLRLRRDLETALAERDKLGQRVAELERETAALKQSQADFQQRLAAASQNFNATPGVGGRVTASTDPNVPVTDSMDYLKKDSTVVTDNEAPKTYKPRAKTTRKKATPTKRKRRRR